jgi:hypothetical protein
VKQRRARAIHVCVQLGTETRKNKCLEQVHLERFKTSDLSESQHTRVARDAHSGAAQCRLLLHLDLVDDSVARARDDTRAGAYARVRARTRARGVALRDALGSARFKRRAKRALAFGSVQLLQ